MSRIIIHGGAGTIGEAKRPAYRRGLEAALDAAWQVLATGGEATEAVLRAVETMEANAEAFNAGVGGSPNREGFVELDAAVMRGLDGSAGAVAGVRTARSAVRLADLVRRETPHVLLMGAGADALVQDPLDPDELLTPQTREAWWRWREQAEGADPDAAPAPAGTTSAPSGSNTVGAVAVDRDGGLAAATSTGGMLGKWPGRVGDSPLIGAGTYADRLVAVSATGKGEAFIRAVTAKALAERLAAGAALDAVLERALAEVREMGGHGGLIVATADGRLAHAFDTPQMGVGWIDEHARHALVDVDARVQLWT